jgi:hypothetical protein
MPGSNAVLGGTEIGDNKDWGYGPPRYLRPSEVREVAAHLNSVSADELLADFDSDEMNASEIYPHGWRDAKTERDWIREAYLRLVEHYDNAARQGDAMILFLC